MTRFHVVCITVFIFSLQSSFGYSSPQRYCIPAKILPITSHEIEVGELNDIFQERVKTARTQLQAKYNKSAQLLQKIWFDGEIGYSAFFLSKHKSSMVDENDDPFESYYEAWSTDDNGFRLQGYWGREKWREERVDDYSEDLRETIDDLVESYDEELDNGESLFQKALDSLGGEPDTRPRLLMYGWGGGAKLPVDDASPVKLTILDKGNYIVVEAKKGDSYEFLLLKGHKDEYRNYTYKIVNNWITAPNQDIPYQFALAHDKKGFSMLSIQKDGITIFERRFMFKEESFEEITPLEHKTEDPAYVVQLLQEQENALEKMRITNNVIKRKEEKEYIYREILGDENILTQYEFYLKTRETEKLIDYIKAIDLTKLNKSKDLENAVKEVLSVAAIKFIDEYFEVYIDAIVKFLNENTDISHIKDAILEFAQQGETNKKKADYLAEELYLYCNKKLWNIEWSVSTFLYNKLSESIDEEIDNAQEKAELENKTFDRESYENEKKDKLRTLVAILKQCEKGGELSRLRFDVLSDHLMNTKAELGAVKKGKETINDLADVTIASQYGDVIVLPKNAELFVFGDIHADSYSLVHNIQRVRSRIRDKKGVNVYAVFVGDYVNNGLDSIGSLEAILGFQKKYPKNVILLNGNHEFRETYGTVVKEYFFTHWKNAISNKEHQKGRLKQPPFEHYGHIRFELIEEYGFLKGEELYKEFEEWGRHLPYMVVTTDGRLISHSLGLSNDLKEKKFTLLDLYNAKKIDSEFIRKEGYEGWKAGAANTQHASMVNNRKNIPELIKKFKEHIGVRTFLFGHTHYRTGEIMPGSNDSVVTLCSSEKASPTAGYYIRHEMDTARLQATDETQPSKIDSSVDRNNRGPMNSSYAWFREGWTGKLNPRKNIYTVSTTPDYNYAVEDTPPLRAA